VLHVSPESHLGGPLALVRDGDEIALDVEARRLDLCLDEAEWKRRQAAWQPSPVTWERGYQAMFAKHVTQADQGCDFDFLAGRSPGQEPSIF
jgi:dihydroxy-acid dehydratase